MSGNDCRDFFCLMKPNSREAAGLHLPKWLHILFACSLYWSHGPSASYQPLTTTRCCTKNAVVSRQWRCRRHPQGHRACSPHLVHGPTHRRATASRSS